VVVSAAGRGGERRGKQSGFGREGAAAAAGERPGLAARRAAAKLLAAVIDARTPLDGLTDAEGGHPQFLALDGRDRALVRAILATALRFRVTIGRMLGRQLERGLPPKAHALAHLLHVAAAQMLFLDVPDSAAVDLAVSHAKTDPRTARFAGLVNGVLRSLARDKAALPEVLASTIDAPDWLAERLASAYGDGKAAAILAAHRIEAPIDFTVRSDPVAWAERLGGVVLPTGSVRVEDLPAPIPDLPGFAEGQWWVQDAAASLPGRLLGTVEGMRVADLCAAPGGKTAELALAGAEVTALDISASRLRRLAANLDRLRLRAGIVQADLLAYEPPALFDAVLLDAPCSSTGTIRRHPDVAWTKTPEDVMKLAALQKRMLARAVALTRPGGLVVYANCSLDPAEGEHLVEAFLAGTEDVVLESFQPDEAPGIAPFLTPRGWLRTTPADMVLSSPALSGLDGFFAARLRRVR
jgi:16S rRNA (cytosine967-C5)-methyltransferase